MFLHLSVILFTGGGVCLSACWDAPPREQTPPPPWEQIPPEQTATVADGTHPTGMHSWLFCEYLSKISY